MAKAGAKKAKKSKRMGRAAANTPPKKSGKMTAALAMIEIVALLTILALIFWDRGLHDWIQDFNAPALKQVEISDISSPQGVLMQSKGMRVLGSKNMEERVYPASLTKIMTTIVAIEELDDLNQEISLNEDVFDALYGRDATQAGFQAGERVRAIDLLYGAMLPSGAECCLGLACSIAGSEDAFVALMNKKAEKIGMKNTHFCDSTGLHDENHYSTPLDLAILFRYALRNDTFREIVKSPWHATPGTNIHPDGITYYSTIFKGIPDPYVTGGRILGGKTGYTSQAGLCLASFAEIEGREYILVTTGAAYDGENYQDALEIYNRVGSLIQTLK